MTGAESGNGAAPENGAEPGHAGGSGNGERPVVPPGPPPGPGLWQAMPRPLLIVFLALGMLAVLATLVLVARPPRFDTVALESRRPPPRTPYTHDPIRVNPIVLPREPLAYDPPCDAVARARPLAGPGGMARLRAVLARVCELAGPGVPPALNEAVRGLDGTTIRFARFDRSGAESTADVTARTIWLNVKLSGAKLPVSQVAPPLLHDAWHLARAGQSITAREELAARAVEIATCRQLVNLSDWPRWCRDAADLTAMPPAQAEALLRRAGFA